jgi:hypothetical protein
MQSYPITIPLGVLPLVCPVRMIAVFIAVSMFAVLRIV